MADLTILRRITAQNNIRPAVAPVRPASLPGIISRRFAAGAIGGGISDRWLGSRLNLTQVSSLSAGIVSRYATLGGSFRPLDMAVRRMRRPVQPDASAGSVRRTTLGLATQDAPAPASYAPDADFDYGYAADADYGTPEAMGDDYAADAGYDTPETPAPVARIADFQPMIMRSLFAVAPSPVSSTAGSGIVSRFAAPAETATEVAPVTMTQLQRAPAETGSESAEAAPENAQASDNFFEPSDSDADFAPDFAAPAPENAPQVSREIETTPAAQLSREAEVTAQPQVSREAENIAGEAPAVSYQAETALARAFERLDYVDDAPGVLDTASAGLEANGSFVPLAMSQRRASNVSAASANVARVADTESAPAVRRVNQSEWQVALPEFSQPNRVESAAPSASGSVARTSAPEAAPVTTAEASVERVSAANWVENLGSLRHNPAAPAPSAIARSYAGAPEIARQTSEARPVQVPTARLAAFEPVIARSFAAPDESFVTDAPASAVSYGESAAPVTMSHAQPSRNIPATTAAPSVARVSESAAASAPAPTSTSGFDTPRAESGVAGSQSATLAEFATPTTSAESAAAADEPVVNRSYEAVAPVSDAGVSRSYEAASPVSEFAVNRSYEAAAPVVSRSYDASAPTALQRVMSRAETFAPEAPTSVTSAASTAAPVGMNYLRPAQAPSVQRSPENAPAFAPLAPATPAPVQPVVARSVENAYAAQSTVSTPPQPVVARSANLEVGSLQHNPGVALGQNAVQRSFSPDTSSAPVSALNMTVARFASFGQTPAPAGEMAAAPVQRTSVAPEASETSGFSPVAGQADAPSPMQMTVARFAEMSQPNSGTRLTNFVENRPGSQPLGADATDFEAQVVERLTSTVSDNVIARLAESNNAGGFIQENVAPVEMTYTMPPLAMARASEATAPSLSNPAPSAPVARLVEPVAPPSLPQDTEFPLVNSTSQFVNDRVDGLQPSFTPTAPPAVSRFLNELPEATEPSYAAAPAMSNPSRMTNLARQTEPAVTNAPEVRRAVETSTNESAPQAAFAPVEFAHLAPAAATNGSAPEVARISESNGASAPTTSNGSYDGVATDNLLGVYEPETPRFGNNIEAETPAPEMTHPMSVLQRSIAPTPPTVTMLPQLDKVLRTSQGQPMDSGTQARMSHIFGVNFEPIRVHSGAEVARALDTMGNAEGFTAGRNIYVRDYQPGTPKTDSVIGHELTHVMQRASLPSLGNGLMPDVSAAGQHLEHEAQHNEAMVFRHLESIRSPQSAQPTSVLRLNAPTPTTSAPAVDTAAITNEVMRAFEPVHLQHLQNNSVQREPEAEPGSVISREVAAPQGNAPANNSNEEDTEGGQTRPGTQPKGINMEEIAEEVYRRIKSKLMVERERHGVNGRRFF
jgi:hypothetical protein